ncbi:MAG: hypothetical protein IH624_12705 [Phycisphaerae bacterium]|nr:hypothetical protein [Phycisphaerae bacterium]
MVNRLSVPFVLLAVLSQVASSQEDLLNFLIEQNEAAREKIKTADYRVTWAGSAETKEGLRLDRGSGKVKLKGAWRLSIQENNASIAATGWGQKQTPRMVINDKYLAYWPSFGNGYIYRDDHQSLSDASQLALELHTSPDIYALNVAFGGQRSTTFREVMKLHPDKIRWTAEKAKLPDGGTVYFVTRYVPSVNDAPEPDAVWTIDPHKGFMVTGAEYYSKAGNVWVTRKIEPKEVDGGVWVPVSYEEHRYGEPTDKRANEKPVWSITVQLEAITINHDLPDDVFAIESILPEEYRDSTTLMHKGLDGNTEAYVYRNGGYILREDWLDHAVPCMQPDCTGTSYSAGQGEELAAVMPGELPEYADLKAAIEAAYAKRDALLANSKGEARLTLEKQGHSEQAVERLQERISDELKIDPSKVALLGRASWTVEWYNKGAKKRYDMLVKEAEQPAGSERLLLPEHKRIATDGQQGIQYNVGRGEAYINKPPLKAGNPTNLTNYFRIDRLYRPGRFGTLPETLDLLQEYGNEPTVSQEVVDGHACLKLRFDKEGDLSNGKKYKTAVEFWIVPNISYSVIKAEMHSSRRTGGGEPPLLEGFYASYEESNKFQGIWLLKNVTIVVNDGPFREKLTASLSDTEISIDIPDGTFTFGGLGVPAGTLVYDKTQGSRPVVTRYRPDRLTDEPSDASTSEPKAGDGADELLKFVLGENTKARSKVKSVSYRFELVSEVTSDVQGDNLPAVVERGPRSTRFQLSGEEYKLSKWRNSLMHSRQRITMLESGRQTEQNRSEHTVINDDFAVSWHIGNPYAYQFDHTSIAHRSDRSKAHMLMLSIDPIEFGFGTEEHTLAEAYDIMKDKHRWTAQEGTYEGRQVYLVKQFSPQMSDPNQPVCLYVIDPAKGFLITHFTGRYYDGQLNHEYEVEVARVDGTDIWLASKVVEKHYRMAAHTSQYVPKLMSKATTVISDVKVNEVLGDELFMLAALNLTDDICLMRKTVDDVLVPMMKRDGVWQPSSPTKPLMADCLPDSHPAYRQ